MPGTTTTATKKSWDERAQELIDFYHEYGHFTLPGAKEYNGLRCWVKRLREWHEREEQGIHRKHFTLSTKRVKELNAIGFPWKVKKQNYHRHEEKDSEEGRWQRRVQDLRDFKREHGHLNVPYRFPENVSFGYWMVTVRKTFRIAKKGEQTFLTPERIIELDDLGFPWAVLGGRIMSEEDQEQQNQELRREKKENIVFIKQIRDDFSQMPQQQQKPALPSSEGEARLGTKTTAKKKSPTNEKRKKGKEKVQTKQKKKKEKRKAPCEETDIQPSIKKKKKKQRKNHADAGIAERQSKKHNKGKTKCKSENDDSSSPLSSRLLTEQPQGSPPVANAPPVSSRLLRSDYQQDGIPTALRLAVPNGNAQNPAKLNVHDEIIELRKQLEEAEDLVRVQRFEIEDLKNENDRLREEKKQLEEAEDLVRVQRFEIEDLKNENNRLRKEKANEKVAASKWKDRWEELNAEMNQMREN